ncbi:hypothetical protein LEP1GSC103_3257 [Leptospira borgpetersenii serovar Javanica str. UI 09931]|uniref:Uncharacterized protein n=5 Tax=Leptospira borgpetersenii TaxID=174 RepID=M3GAI2_LEPBO|nr:hypothetical protein LBBP_02144 [Leptospira borgpetersenii serovar Ballum]ANH01045.1 Uncharacterized protein LB4E_1709 [Leptospira borgpetersenii str. 4E]EKP14111.1 hypothetical protein LEP1GSC128_2825 [Leptospira borgpetersenii str. 200801926]EKQ90718.1 hypothetical protein LEP1GSC101_0695 [Leptospira borgpetersenii str. UI 09149]EKR00183.1 hypothetical protein LEP1GSC121_3760 [Leptospira borgpetersenii serovar Castellonis str. 200801910]EMF97921.1 hypothetical protein LEP1GSC123_4125 [Lep
MFELTILQKVRLKNRDVDYLITIKTYLKNTLSLFKLELLKN